MEKVKQFFVSGIDTNVGKTITSAVLVEALQADYWKPIQSGDLDYSDTMKVMDLITNKHSAFHPNTYQFATPASPHYAAKIDKQYIDVKLIRKPIESKNLIVEGAGGLMVPLNDRYLIIDLIKQLHLEVILVVKNYLGSINHSLLSIEALKSWQIPIKGIIFNGSDNASSENYIMEYSGIKCLGKIPKIETIDKKTIQKISKQFEFLRHD